MLKKFVNSKTILFSMLVMQLAWIFGIWITRATDNYQKLVAVGAFSVVSYLGVIFLRGTTLENINRCFDRLASSERKLLIVVFLVLLAGGILYASQQIAWTDEMQYFDASKLIVDKGLKTFFDQYQWNNYLANRHPPLGPLLFSLAMTVFGENLMTLRMVTLVSGFALLAASYFLGEALFGKKEGVLAAFFMLTFPLVVRESTAGLLDVQATFFFTIALLLAWKLAHKPSWMLAIGLGLSMGLGFLTKYMVMFILPLLFVFFLLRRGYRTTASPVFLSLSLAGVLLMIWTWFGSHIGVRVPSIAGISPSDLFASALAASTRPVPEGLIIEHIALSPGFFFTSEWGRGFLMNSLLTRLPSGLGAYNLPLILLGLVGLAMRRKAADGFLFLWMVLISLILVLTLPDHRYFMLIFPALAITIARWLKSQTPSAIGQVTLLALLFQLGSLFLMVDWVRVNELFIK